MAGPFPHVEAGNAWARGVVAGDVPACKWVKLACQRHLDDLERQHLAVYVYSFDPAKASKPCKFIELMPHTKGKWARSAEKITLEPWQCFKTIAIFGWVRKADGLRRYRKVLILEPRKNAKSTWAAGVGLYMFCADGEYGSEVYSGATTEKQAWEVFRPARLMAKNTPSLLRAFGITVGAKNLHMLGNGSRFEPMIGTPGDGASPSCGIHDEYHEHDTDAQVDAIETGMGAREQPLQIIITTAGDNLAGPCYALQLEAQKVLEGVLVNDELFALIFTVDPEDDWTSEAALLKANPNYDVSVSGEFLRARQRDAINNARKVGIFKTKHLNMWVQARDAYFNVQRWIESGVVSPDGKPAITLADFKGQPVKIGLDLASKVDIAAMELVFDLEACTCEVAERLRTIKRQFGDAEIPGYRYARFGRYYLPEKTIELGENEHYQGWVRDGWVTQTDGDMIDYFRILEDIVGEDDGTGKRAGGLVSDLQVEEVAYDPHQATMLVTALTEAGVPCVEVRPLVLNFSEPMKEMEGRIRARAIAHDGDPVFTWMLSNVVAKPDRKDNVYPNKLRPENKIDGPVAHMMALARHMAASTGPSVYDGRGLLMF
jgi:phage terminase large subunit-like protein